MKLQDGAAPVICDFAMVAQDAVSAFHWTYTHTTVQPFSIYLKDVSSDSAQFFNLTIVSDCSKHDSVAVYLFSRHVVQFLKAKSNVKKTIYYSDGAVSQYKNIKNFCNLMFH